MTRTLLMRPPRTASIAGSNVSAASTDTAGMSIPPMPIERISGSGSATIASRPMATVEPDVTTDFPACVIVSTSAVSTSSPSRSSSLKRKITTRA